MQIATLLSWRPFGAALLAGSVGLGGMHMDQHATLAPAVASAGMTEPVPVGAVAVGKPGAAQIDLAGTPPGERQVVRAKGAVTAITPDPGTFTVREQDGQEITYRVSLYTMFVAGRDRPYRFDLLKIGDDVNVRGGASMAAAGRKPARGNEAPAAKSGASNPNAASLKPPAALDPSDPTPVARAVMVRPAGARRPGAMCDGQRPTAAPKKGVPDAALR